MILNAKAFLAVPSQLRKDIPVMQYLYFMRHGETPYNRDGKVQGRTDIPLNEDGIIEAKLAGDFFRDAGICFDLVISSPLQRALKTASIIKQVPEDEIEQDARAIELNFGTAEGGVVPELPQGVLNLFYEPEKYEVPEGGESVDELEARCGDFLADMAQRLRHHPELRHVLIVSHGAALRGFISCVEHTQRKDFWAGNLENCCVYKVAFDGETYSSEDYLHPLKGTDYMVPPWIRASGQAVMIMSGAGGLEETGDEDGAAADEGDA